MRLLRPHTPTIAAYPVEARAPQAPASLRPASVRVVDAGAASYRHRPTAGDGSLGMPRGYSNNQACFAPAGIKAGHPPS